MRSLKKKPAPFTYISNDNFAQLKSVNKKETVAFFNLWPSVEVLETQVSQPSGGLNQKVSQHVSLSLSPSSISLSLSLSLSPSLSLSHLSHGRDAVSDGVERRLAAGARVVKAVVAAVWPLYAVPAVVEAAPPLLLLLPVGDGQHAAAAAVVEVEPAVDADVSLLLLLHAAVVGGLGEAELAVGHPRGRLPHGVASVLQLEAGAVGPVEVGAGDGAASAVHGGQEVGPQALLEMVRRGCF